MIFQKDDGTYIDLNENEINRIVEFRNNAIDDEDVKHQLEWVLCNAEKAVYESLDDDIAESFRNNVITEKRELLKQYDISNITAINCAIGKFKNNYINI